MRIIVCTTTTKINGTAAESILPDFGGQASLYGNNNSIHNIDRVAAWTFFIHETENNFTDHPPPKLLNKILNVKNLVLKIYISCSNTTSITHLRPKTAAMRPRRTLISPPLQSLYWLCWVHPWFVSEVHLLRY